MLHKSTVNCVIQSTATVVVVSKRLSKQHSHFSKSIRKSLFPYDCPKYDVCE